MTSPARWLLLFALPGCGTARVDVTSMYVLGEGESYVVASGWFPGPSGWPRYKSAVLRCSETSDEAAWLTECHPYVSTAELREALEAMNLETGTAVFRHPKEPVHVRKGQWDGAK